MLMPSWQEQDSEKDMLVESSFKINILPAVQVEEGKKQSQSESSEFGAVDFEGYFEDSASGGQALNQLWNDRR